MKGKKNPAAVALGSLGGKARALKLSDKRKSEIAKLAVTARERNRKARRQTGSRRTRYPRTDAVIMMP